MFINQVFSEQLHWSPGLKCTQLSLFTLTVSGSKEKILWHPMQFAWQFHILHFWLHTIPADNSCECIVSWKHVKAWSVKRSKNIGGGDEVRKERKFLPHPSQFYFRFLYYFSHNMPSRTTRTIRKKTAAMQANCVVTIVIVNSAVLYKCVKQWHYR